MTIDDEEYLISFLAIKKHCLYPPPKIFQKVFYKDFPMKQIKQVMQDSDLF